MLLPPYMLQLTDNCVGVWRSFFPFFSLFFFFFKREEKIWVGSDPTAHKVAGSTPSVTAAAHHRCHSNWQWTQHPWVTGAALWLGQVMHPFSIQQSPSVQQPWAWEHSDPTAGFPGGQQGWPHLGSVRKAQGKPCPRWNWKPPQTHWKVLILLLRHTHICHSALVFILK